MAGLATGYVSLAGKDDFNARVELVAKKVNRRFHARGKANMFTGIVRTAVFDCLVVVTATVLGPDQLLSQSHRKAPSAL